MNRTETDSCRANLAKWCNGNGLDIGHGGAPPIVPNALCIDLAVGDPLRANYGDTWPTHLVWNAFTQLPFHSWTFDFVFSSHCLEDAQDTAGVLREWCRVLKPGGYLVLFLPDQKTYEAICIRAGGIPNQAHKHKDFSLAFVTERLPSCMAVVETIWPFLGNPYSFSIVAIKMQ